MSLTKTFKVGMVFQLGDGSTLVIKKLSSRAKKPTVTYQHAVGEMGERPRPIKVKEGRFRAFLGTTDAVQVHGCRECGCTAANCQGCVERTGQPCHWVEPDLCSACSPAKADQ